MNDLRVVAFDLDDTLAVSKSQIDRRMAELLGHLLTEVDVLIISGGRFEQFQAQVLAHLDLTEEQCRRLHLMPTCGTRYYRWMDGDWRLVYAEDLSEADKARVVAALTESAQALDLWESKTWGDIIEDRGSQITFSALGQSAPPAEKYGWDPDGSKKKRLREAVAAKLPDLEVRSGGSTSIDVTRKGVDKAYGMRKLLECLDLKIDNVLFVGDRLDVGGNDYPVKDMGIRCVAVTRWEETADYVEALVDDLVKLRAEPA
ncbi:HAD-IIB family hydrolase [Micromonospora sp. NPDC023966]|uniref:HAD-IIB family hydrolase n=1 Tax=Micromonospora sp. NPDC023966 TaxID=3154699 RepID=UPI0033E8BDE2